MDQERTAAATAGRPWSLEAAMEPLPPLAPPPSPPGDRRAVDIATARRREAGSLTAVGVIAFLVLLAVTVVVVLVLVVGR